MKAVEPIRLGRRETQRLETRNRIYEVAIAEFKAVGFAVAQIERIVEAAGVARGTFYFHFPTKEHVLLELQRRREANVAKLLGEFDDRPASIRELLERFVEAMLVQSEDLIETGLMRDLLTVYIRQPPELDLAVQPLVAELVERFSEAAERGEVRSDLEARDLVVLFGTQLFGFLLLGMASQPPEERDEAFKNMLDVFIRGIAL